MIDVTRPIFHPSLVSVLSLLCVTINVVSNPPVQLSNEDKIDSFVTSNTIAGSTQLTCVYTCEPIALVLGSHFMIKAHWLMWYSVEAFSIDLLPIFLFLYVIQVLPSIRLLECFYSELTFLYFVLCTAIFHIFIPLYWVVCIIIYFTSTITTCKYMWKFLWWQIFFFLKFNIKAYIKISSSQRGLLSWEPSWI